MKITIANIYNDRKQMFTNRRILVSIYGSLLICFVILVIYFNLYNVNNIYKRYSTGIIIQEKNITNDGNCSYHKSQNKESLYPAYRTVDAKHAININEVKNILFWDDFHGDVLMNLGPDNIFKGCPVASCYTTHNRSYMPVEQFDAIIFHTARFNSKKSGVPSKRSPKQKYIFFSWESPFNCYFDKNYTKNFYNWTLNYRRDADIHFPYGMFVPNKYEYHMSTPLDLKTKNRTAMWMVSNCHSAGIERRAKYVKELQKYIDVDVYGGCGTMKCGNQCHKLMEDNYYFYLSFENSQAWDYVTEKMFERMQHNVVPVVLGNSDYSAIAPNYSVINTRDFATPKYLAEFLVKLKNNLTEYVKYFEWKKHYHVNTTFSPRNYAGCQLCEMLHRPVVYSNYEDVEDWYFNVNSYLK